RSRPLVWGIASLATGLTAILILVGATRSADRPAAWLAAKGPAAKPVLQARCPQSPPGQCRRGDSLLFEVDGATQGGWFAAYSEDPAAQRLWYFPDARGHLAQVAGRAGYSLVPMSARIGPEHAIGRHTVHLFLLDHPV